MSAELTVELIGKLVIALCGLVIGSWLWREGRRSNNRVMLHWSVMFLSAAGYVFGALIVLGWGNAAALTRMHFLLGLVGVLPGALAATILMLPLHEQVGEPLSLYVPLAVMAGLSLAVLTGTVHPGQPREEYVYAPAVMSMYVNTMMVAGMLSVAILTYLSVRFKNWLYLALAVAFLLITLGGRVVGVGLLNLALGQLTVLMGYQLFYYVFARLVRMG
jgi:hypothetical protein